MPQPPPFWPCCETLLVADLPLLQVPPGTSTHGQGANRAGLQGTFLNKTTRDRRFCILFCVFPYRVWWFGICQATRLRTDGERCETPLISEGLFQKRRAQAHAGFRPLLSHPSCRDCPKWVSCWWGGLLLLCLGHLRSLVPVLPLPACPILCLIRDVRGELLREKGCSLPCTPSLKALTP